MKIALIILLFFLSESKIPLQFRELADQALQNARQKVPQELREDTKYPGDYEDSDCHFTLKKTFTNAYTKDIKGFAASEKNVAIVKRKRFNIKDNYIFIDPKTQTLYKLKKTIATEDNVIIYESVKTDIFSLMTNFHLYKTTDEYFPLNYTHEGSKVPRLTLSKSFNWNSNTHKPFLNTIPGTNIQYGYGAYAGFGLNTDFSFKSKKDIKLRVSAKLDARIGAEVLVPSNTKINVPNKVLLNLNVAIPGLGFSKKFLGLKVALGSSFLFDVNFTDMSVNIPVGFDYFKGYNLVGTKYIQITPNSVTDSKWDLRFLSLPETSSVSEIKKSFLSAYFIGTFNVVPSFLFGFTIGSYKLNFQVGLVVQFKWKLEFDTKKCMFPYLKATIVIPIDMFYSFSGLKIIFQIIKPKFSRIPIKSYRKGPFCINAPSLFIEGYNKFIQSKEDISTPYYVQNYKFYEKRGSTQYPKQIRFRVVDSNSQVLLQRPFPYTKYETSADSNVISFVSPDVPNNGKFEWRLYYKDSQNIEKQASYYLPISVSSITSEKYSSNANIQLDKSNTDITYFSINLQKCELIETGRIFKRNMDYIAFKPDPSYSGYYASIYFDSEGSLYQNTCDYTSSSWSNLDFREDSLYYQTDENLNIKLTSISSSTDSFSAVINIYLNYQKNSNTKTILLGVYETGVLNKNTLHNAEDIGLGSLSFNCYAPSQNSATITINGKITYQSQGTSTITTKTIYSDGSFSSEVTLAGTTKATFSITKTSPTVIADLYREMFMPEPDQELVAETIKITPEESQTITVNFREQEIYKIIDITLPYDSLLNSANNKYMLFYTEDGSDLRFLYDNSRKSYNEKCFYCYVSSLTYIQIPIRRDETEEKSYDIQIEFLRHDTSTNSDSIEVLNREAHTTIKFDGTVQSAFVTPAVNGQSWFVADGQPNSQYTNNVIYIDEDTALILRKYTQLTTYTTVSVDFYLIYSELTELVPSLTVDLTYMSPLLNKYPSFPYYIYFPNGYKVMAKDDAGEELGTSDVNENGLAQFTLSKTGNITFIPICKDNKGMMCQITYETPTATGYHLIKYPDRDGISTTGCGFLTELIPVVSGQSFTYYKSYEEDIVKVREYSNEEVKLLIKIEDVTSAQYLEGESNARRRICLYKENSPNEIIPFSRNYFNDNYDDLLQALFVTEADLTETNQLDNDEDGCYVLDAYLLSNAKINTLPKGVCDLPSSSITNPNYDPNAGSGDPTKPPQTSDPTKPPVTSDPTKPPVTSDPTKPPQTSDPTKPPQTSDPTKPPQTSDPTKPPQTSDPTKPPQTSDPTKPPQTSDPTKPPQTSDPTKPPQTSDPTKPPVTSDPTKPPVTSDPTEPPVTSDPTKPPVTSDPTKPPQTSDPTEPPVTSDPTKPPVTSDPTEPPVTSDPTKPPVTSDPTKPPVTSDPTKPPQTSDPTKPPVTSDPTKPPQTSDENKPQPDISSIIDETLIQTPLATPPPVEINDTTVKENSFIGQVQFSESPDDIKQDIENMFNAPSNPNQDDKVDQYIIIENKENKDIEFKNLSLKDNQYVKVSNNTNIKLTSGDLNLLLDRSSFKVNINLNDTNDVKLAIKNMDRCTVKFDTQDPEKKSISIDSNLDVYNPISFEYSENIESIELNSINIHKSGSFSSSIPVQTKYLSAQPKMSGKLSKITISNELNIEQSAVLELDDVSLNDATLNLNLHTYTSSNYEAPMLHGTLGKPPSKIVLTKPNDSSKLPEDNEKYLLFQGTFTTTCNEWKGRINYGSAHFNDGVCEDIQSLMTLNEKKSLNILHNPNLKSDKGKKLSGVQIAGIVIGVVLGIALIVVAVIIVIKVMKRRQNTTDENYVDESKITDIEF